MQRTFRIVGAATFAAGLQTLVSLSAIAATARLLDIADFGRFGLYLAWLSAALALDALRQPLVVAHAGARRHDRAFASGLVTISYGMAVLALPLTVAICVWPLDLGTGPATALGLMASAIFCASPGLARIEALRGPEFALAALACSASASIGAAAIIAVSTRDIALAAWAMPCGPVALCLVLALLRHLPRPVRHVGASTWRAAGDAIGTHAITAAGVLLDRGLIAAFGGPTLLGLYVPVAELFSRGSALIGLLLGAFLRDEARVENGLPRQQTGGVRHRGFLTAASVAGLALTTLASFAGASLLSFILGHATPEQVVAFQVLMAGLAINIAAHRGALLLKARGQFNFHLPYLSGIVAATVLAHWLLQDGAILGACALTLLLRVGDLSLIWRTRAELKNIHLLAAACVATIGTALWLR